MFDLITQKRRDEKLTFEDLVIAKVGSLISISYCGFFINLILATLFIYSDLIWFIFRSERGKVGDQNWSGDIRLIGLVWLGLFPSIFGI